ncbi:MAG: hypothetical protein GX963_15600 [Bacteroidales bacterium]|nr:hypothetical protein [Bacteroidales bacterium]
MPKTDERIRSCLELLENLGKQGNSQITYSTIKKITTQTLETVTMQAIDQIYHHLKTKQIEIVDQLPDGIVVDTRSAVLQQKRPARRYRRRARRGQRASRPTTKSNKATKPSYLCPEKGIDLLLYRCDQVGEITEKYFAEIIARCRLSAEEVMELVFYLGSVGVNCPNMYDHVFVQTEDNVRKELLSEVQARAMKLT